jgi:hypothetical protein
MIPKITALVVAFLFVAIGPLEARTHRNHHGGYSHSHQSSLTNVGGPEGFLPHPSGCPWRAFCGCGVSVRVFGHPVRELFLASNWFRFPRALAGAGMVAVRNHHVMFIESYNGDGNATVYDPNSGGHQTRTHLRSLRGYVVVNPHGSHLAMR